VDPNKRKKSLLDKFTSKLNKPVTRDVVVDKTNVSSPNVKKIDPLGTNIQDYQDPKDYKSKNVFFGDSIDFDQPPTREEYERYKSFFKYSSKKRDDNFFIRPSNREKLASRYRQFFYDEGVSQGDTIYRGNTPYNLSVIKNEALLKRFPEQRVEKLVDLVNKNLNFDTVRKDYKEARGGRFYDLNTSSVQVLPNESPRPLEGIYTSSGVLRGGVAGNMYQRYYPEDIYSSVINRRTDPQGILADSLNKNPERNATGYDYEARKFQRYNLEEMINFGLAVPTRYDEDGTEGTSMSTQGFYRFNNKTIYLGDRYGYDYDKHGIYSRYRSMPIYSSQYGGESVEALAYHEGLHGSEFPTGKDKVVIGGGSGFFEKTKPTASYLTGLDAILGMTYKQELNTGGPNDYQDQAMEFGAWFEQEMMEAKNKINNNEFSRDDSDYFVTRAGIKTKEDEKNRLEFLKYILK